MAVTKIADLSIIPQTFFNYAERLVLQKSALVQSGIVQSVPAFIPEKGKTTIAPAFMGFVGADAVNSDSVPITVNKVDSIDATAVINFRTGGFGANDLVAALAGADPMGNLATRYAGFWTRALNATVISSLQGSVAGMEAAFAGKILNDQTLAVIDSDHVLDTLQLMGEYSDQLTHVIMHSATRTKLQKLDKLTVGVQGSANSGLEFYEGRIVVVDDKLVPNGAIYDTYFVGAGAVAYADGTDVSKFIETDRDILQGDDVTTSRKRFIVHPAGTSFTSNTVTGLSPTNAELALAVNWTAADAAEDKRFPVRVLRHLIA